MIVSNCIDSLMELNEKSLTASTIEDAELLKSVAALLYKTKSVRKAIEILDRETKRQEYKMIHHCEPFTHSSNL